MAKIPKRAQISIFITIGIIILILIGVILYLSASTKEAEKAPAIRETLQFPSELQAVGLFVQSCLERESEKTINMTAIQGGRPLSPKHPYIWNNMTLSHGYYMGINDLPTAEEMQTEMGAYLQIHLDDCLNGLSDFKARGMDLQTGQIQPGFKVGSDAVVIDLNYPITLQGKTGKVKVEKFSAVIPSRLGYLHDAARKIVQEDVKTQGKVTFSFISEVSGVGITLNSPEDFVFAVEIYEEKSLQTKTARSFYFMNDYAKNNDPTISYISNVIAYAGEQVSFYANATDADGDDITYSDDSKFFDIDPKTGLIQFTPASTGSEIVKITAKDGKGGEASEAFALDVY